MSRVGLPALLLLAACGPAAPPMEPEPCTPAGGAFVADGVTVMDRDGATVLSDGDAVQVVLGGQGSSMSFVSVGIDAPDVPGCVPAHVRVDSGATTLIDFDRPIGTRSVGGIVSTQPVLFVVDPAPTDAIHVTATVGSATAERDLFLRY